MFCLYLYAFTVVIILSGNVSIVDMLSKMYAKSFKKVYVDIENRDIVDFGLLPYVYAAKIEKIRIKPRYKKT